ncbi:hypothetical protein UAY_01167 [Enterococcus moraviensis ATCC BAA-383]|uniref:Bacteriocin immunity protein n=1 Tax=Enterococcus moraviensis ATCC BAA-383 TaxID=1158609 RepID=R2T9M2_9ENTE|nr:bacteriocin immunity protein [Enterococcus moraviensis]EOI01759.1 hypothetical protein UAY_01167 [Enterococcus moraviensis ATCC BAA-383]EOT73706.1 hypothetical protein I586_00700 [Enterococcus moraviensis ATCC BAA-383]OJG69266.1 hypothetical protein RV09_GL000665 [Enterococcus moraviensis]
MDKESKQLVHALYNSLGSNHEENYVELKEVLMKVYKKLDKPINDDLVMSRLVNYIYFKNLTQKLKFTEEQNQIITKMNEIAKTAGVNNAYKGYLGSVSQFD